MKTQLLVVVVLVSVCHSDCATS